jgi:hypothetical protein
VNPASGLVAVVCPVGVRAGELARICTLDFGIGGTGRALKSPPRCCYPLREEGLTGRNETNATLRLHPHTKMDMILHAKTVVCGHARPNPRGTRKQCRKSTDVGEGAFLVVSAASAFSQR